MQHCARALLLTPEGLILLMKIRGWKRELWITPGGRVNPHEDSIAALSRELFEETGQRNFAINGLVWTRQGTFLIKDRSIEEREEFFHVPTERFEPSTAGFEAEEVNQHLGFRWWSVAELEATTDFMVPARLAHHLRGLLEAGPPPTPVDVSG